jgi:hypothetical protein
MNTNEISDKRTIKEFKGITFSKYKKSEVKKELLKCLMNGKLEQSCYWSCEFICAGHFLDLWEIILLFVSENIHLGNPKLPIYLDSRYEIFKNILLNGYLDNEIKMRNNDKIRHLFAEIMAILCLSKKKHKITKIKFHKEDFNLTNLTCKLQAPNLSYANTIFTKEDPNEFFIAINELGYHLSKDSYNNTMACYWVEWILEYEAILKKGKNVIKVGRREYVPVDSKLQKDIIWLIWDILLYEAQNKASGHVKIIKALLSLFCIKWSVGFKKRRRLILYFAISVITDIFNTNISLFTNKDKIKYVKEKINIIYRQIKKNEEKPATDYLFNNSFTGGAKNLENTIAKLDKMNELAFIPRNK